MAVLERVASAESGHYERDHIIHVYIISILQKVDI